VVERSRSSPSQSTKFASFLRDEFGVFDFVASIVSPIPQPDCTMMYDGILQFPLFVNIVLDRLNVNGAARGRLRYSDIYHATREISDAAARGLTFYQPRASSAQSRPGPVYHSAPSTDFRTSNAFLHHFFHVQVVCMEVSVREMMQLIDRSLYFR
jgi:hypothetical protein